MSISDIHTHNVNNLAIYLSVHRVKCYVVITKFGFYKYRSFTIKMTIIKFFAFHQLRSTLCARDSSDFLLVGPAICTGLSEPVIKNIVKSIHHIETEDDLLSLGITSHVYCSPILHLVKSY